MNGSVVTLPAEGSSVNVSIRIIDDQVVERRQEMFSLTLSSTLPGVTIGNERTAEITIIDDDGLFSVH